MRIVVLGGSGNFGARIVRALIGDPAIEVMVAGRRPIAPTGAEGARTAVLDMSQPDFPARLKALSPGLVIHCVGAFQGQDYRVARAALSAGAHYLDLADGRDFVAGFSRALTGDAMRADRVAITGASTLPALSTAAIDSMLGDLTNPEKIAISIAPGQKAPRGTATLEAVFSYLGRPIQVWIDGAWRTRFGWMDLERFDFLMGSRWGGACDVPDLALLPSRYPTVRTVRFHAALEFRLQHLVLWVLAALRRYGVPLPVDRIAVATNRMAGVFDRWAGGSGGMQVSLVGSDASGRKRRRTWQLRAPGLDGPEIPCMAAIVLARRLARGEKIAAGAYPCMGFVALAEFQPEFRRWGIETTIEESAA